MKKALRLNEKDNVLVALCDLKRSETVEGVTISEDVAKGHKIAAFDLKRGENVVKYGFPIGHTTRDIKRGEHVHTESLVTNLSENEEYGYKKEQTTFTFRKCEYDIEVYKRANGQVGIRNELWVLPLVGCVNGEAKEIVRSYVENHADKQLDGVYAFSHPYGCSQLGDDHVLTRTILQKIAKHPNAAGVLVLGLGCENNQMSEFIKTLGEYDSKRIRFLVAQDVEDEIAEGEKLLLELYENAKFDKREKGSLSDLKIGLKCGGSDGLSGITANPLVGKVSDVIIAMGGTSVLTEVPEMFGAERLLMARAKDEEVFQKIVKLVNGFKDYYRRNGQTVYENPSPGNKAGGITTLEDKSLGCTQKSGVSEVVDVVFDDGVIEKKGLNLLNGPGNDMVASTNLAAAGCHLILFTTGRGTPFGSFVPTIKISTNDALFERKTKWIDFNAGEVLNEDFDKSAEELTKLIGLVASGKKTRNELNNSKEIAIFKSGVTL